MGTRLWRAAPRGWSGACVGLALAGFAIRVIAAQAQGLNINEEFAFNVMRGTSWIGTFDRMRELDAHPPLFYWIMRGAYVLGLKSFQSWRALSAVAGAASLLLFLFLAGRGWGRGVALTAGAMAALSLALVRYEGEARMYGWLNLWFMACLVGHYAYLQTRRSAALILAILAQTAAAMTAYLAYVGFLAVGLAAVICLIRMKDRKRLWLWILAQALFLGVPVCQALQFTSVSQGLLAEAGRSSASGIVGQQITLNLPAWAVWLWWMGARTWPLTVALVALAGAGAIGGAEERETSSAHADAGREFLRLFAPLALMISLASMLVMPRLFRAYTFLYAVPWLYCLAAAGIRMIRIPLWRNLTGAGVLLMFLPSLWLYVTHESAEAWRTTVAYLKENSPDAPFPIFTYHFGVSQVLEANGYNGPGELIGLPEDLIGPVPRETVQAHLARFRSANPDAPAIVVYFRPPLREDLDVILDVLQAHYGRRSGTVFPSRLFPFDAEVYVDVFSP